jgi:hypothetical protein
MTDDEMNKRLDDEELRRMRKQSVSETLESYDPIVPADTLRPDVVLMLAREMGEDFVTGDPTVSPDERRAAAILAILLEERVTDLSVARCEHTDHRGRPCESEAMVRRLKACHEMADIIAEITLEKMVAVLDQAERETSAAVDYFGFPNGMPRA